MINTYHHQHDLQIILNAAQNVFNSVNSKYGFTKTEFTFSQNTMKAVSISIKKKGLIICCLISKREGFELLYIADNWRHGQYKTIFSFTDIENKYFLNYKEHILKIDILSNSRQKYSLEWYETYLRGEIHFIEEHFPTVFTEGDLSMF
jgi:hypothetical protein